MYNLYKELQQACFLFFFFNYIFYFHKKAYVRFSPDWLENINKCNSYIS